MYKKPNKMNMTVSIDADYYTFLKRLSYKLSAKEENKIGLSEVVRRALETHWPMLDDQMEMDFKSEDSDEE